MRTRKERYEEAVKKIEEGRQILADLAEESNFDDTRYYSNRLQEILECDEGESGLIHYVKNHVRD